MTYGPLAVSPEGDSFHEQAVVEQDFATMAANGINSLRTYTVPPRWLLDCAQRHGLWVLVGLPWEQHIAFLNHPASVRRIVKAVREGILACAGHPALLGFAIGNEIPSPIVRWHGPRAVEKFIERLYYIAKAVDPAALVTYVNYPSTEYLELPFVDIYCFNVYLESPARYEAYLARLNNLAGDKPLLLTETGLDSHRHGEDKQATVLDWQIRLAFTGGCAGVFVFAWTDEWYRGGSEILDWDFGLVRRDRTPKPALGAVQHAFAEIPFPTDTHWPRISIVICTYNGTATLAETLAGVQRIEYPNYEVLVVNDGSSPAITGIVEKFSAVRLINIPHSGLSVARNVGSENATGLIVAYLDDDAWPDPHWLQYLAFAFKTEGYAAVGGPNIPPPSKKHIPTSVAHAPGGPIHVLLTDREAEHIPGCNMAFRRTALKTIGGFDPRFRTAGDDVDMCWRFHDVGFGIGFHPGAMVWHHRRKTIGAYLKQQAGYGRAEAILERKWPAKYNAAGQPAWHGRIYGTGRLSVLSLSRSRIYHGIWGSAPFQSLYEPAPSTLWSLARMPEWHVIIFLLTLIVCLYPIWNQLIYAWPLLVVAVVIPVIQAVMNARRLPLRSLSERSLVALLNLLQPLARLYGRVGAGLTPWGRRRLRGFALPYSRRFTVWSEHWRSLNEWLLYIETPLEDAGATIYRGGVYDRWDLEVRGGVLGGIRLTMVVEEHGQGRQMMRVFACPRWPFASLIIGIIFTALAGLALLDAAWITAGLFGAVGLICLLAMFMESAAAMAALRDVLRLMRKNSVKIKNPSGIEVTVAKPQTATPP